MTLSNETLKKFGVGKPVKDFLILTFSQFILLHRTVMAFPEAFESDDPEMQGLLERKLVEQTPQAKNRYTPTSAGVQHITPERLRQDPRTKDWPDRVPLTPH